MKSECQFFNSVKNKTSIGTTHAFNLLASTFLPYRYTIWKPSYQYVLRYWLPSVIEGLSFIYEHKESRLFRCMFKGKSVSGLRKHIKATRKIKYTCTSDTTPPHIKPWTTKYTQKLAYAT